MAIFRIGLLLVIFGLLLMAFGLYWSRYMKKDQATLEITPVGLDEFGIRLESPYGTRSVHHVLLINNTPHNLIACEILFEFVTHSGETHTARKVVGYTELLSATPAQRAALLKTQPGIAPHSKMLIGLGVEPDLVRVSGQLPAVSNPSVEEKPETLQRYQRLVIKLNAAVLENREAIGPGGPEFLHHLETLLRGENDERHHD